MRKKLFLLALTMTFALIVTILGASCAQPPPSPWSPEEEWRPMSPEEARPEIGVRIVIYGGEYDLEPSQAFYLWYRWGFVPTNEAYNLTSGEPVTAYWNLQDRTDSANCRYTVTMNGEPLKPTDSFTAICNWYRFWNSPLPSDSVDYWAVAPRFVLHEYYVEFPQGLSEGTYEIFLYGQPSRGEPFSHTTYLHVEWQ